MLEHLVEMGGQSLQFGLAFVFGALVLCGFGLPLPEDIILVAGGVLAWRDTRLPEATLQGMLQDPGLFWMIIAGLAGLGDLVLTCTGTLSRNRALGLRLASGKRLETAEAETRMVAEGVRTTESALALARRAGVPLPICQEVSAVLFEGKPPQAALRTLLEREVRPEEELPSPPGGRASRA